MMTCIACEGPLNQDGVCQNCGMKHTAISYQDMPINHQDMQHPTVNNQPKDE